MHMVKRWLTPPQYDRPGSHLEFFLKIQHAHGQKIIDPPAHGQRWLTVEETATRKTFYPRG